MIKYIFLFWITILSINATFANEFYINDFEIEALFESAEIAVPQNQLFNPLATINYIQSPYNLEGGDIPIVAFLLAFFLGSIGVHRWYLGTSGGTVVGYLLTCGGCGIISLVDTILLLVGTIEDDVSKYVDNPRFIMW